MVGIKDFDMPYNCYDCELHNYHECNLTSESIEDDYCWNGDSREKHCPLIEAISKVQYEARLKADLVAMLEVIKLRIDDLPEPLNRDRVNYCIQEKINALKAEIEPQEKDK